MTTAKRFCPACGREWHLVMLPEPENCSGWKCSSCNYTRALSPLPGSLPPEAATGTIAIDAVPVYSNATRVEDKPVDKNTPHCVGCGGWHGGVNAEINCMRDEIKRLRAK